MSARIAAARRNRHFTLELPLETPDGFGGVVRTYQPGPRLWGAMELLRTTARRRAARPEGVATHRLTFPFRDGVSSAMRLTLGLRRFQVQEAGDPDGRRRALVCLVEEMTP